MNIRRGYSMVRRAESAEATRSGILRAAFQLVGERPTLEIVLADVAERSGVTVKTILRHFGSRDGLFDAVAEYARGEIQEERIAPVGDPRAAVEVIVDHYELRGDWVYRILTQEASDPRAAAAAAQGRAVHRDWVRETFAPQLAPEGRVDELIDLLVVATDLYTWRLLRRDLGLDRATTEQRMRALVARVLEESP